MDISREFISFSLEWRVWPNTCFLEAGVTRLADRLLKSMGSWTWTVMTKYWVDGEMMPAKALLWTRARADCEEVQPLLHALGGGARTGSMRHRRQGHVKH